MKFMTIFLVMLETFLILNAMLLAFFGYYIYASVFLVLAFGMIVMAVSGDRLA